MEPVKDGTRSWQPSLKIAVAYAAFASLWILLSDTVVAAIASDDAEVTRLQSLKGIAFVIVCSGLLYLLIYRTIDSIRRSQKDAAESEGPLELALSHLPINVWTTDKQLRLLTMRGDRDSRRRFDPDQLIGKRVDELVGPGEPQPAMVQPHREALEGRYGRYLQEVDGGVWFDCTVGPLRSGGGEVIGCVGFSLDVTERIAGETERVAALERLERLNEERELLLRHLVRAEEEERKRIAAGIHDDSIQVMTSAGMALDLLSNRLTEGEDRDLATRARSLVTDAIGRLRSLVFQLRPVELEETGLAPALRLLLKKASIESGFEFSLVDESSRTVAGDRVHVLYQVAQESIANIRKHSGAEHVDVRLMDVDEGVKVIIRDDGRGFDPSAPRGDHHFGLTDMRERIQVIGGTCSLTSAPGSGTLVEIWAPAGVRPLQSSVAE